MAASRYGTYVNSASECSATCDVTASHVSLLSGHRGEAAAVFQYHSAAVTSVEWAYHDPSVFASSGDDNQV